LKSISMTTIEILRSRKTAPSHRPEGGTPRHLRPGQVCTVRKYGVSLWEVDMTLVLADTLFMLNSKHPEDSNLQDVFLAGR